MTVEVEDGGGGSLRFLYDGGFGGFQDNFLFCKFSSPLIVPAS